MREMFRRQKIIDASREKNGLPPLEDAKRKRSKKISLEEADAVSISNEQLPSRNNATPANNVNSGRISTPEQAKGRIDNKKKGAHRMKEIIKNHADDVCCLKWKVRLLCRFNPKKQYDPADASLQNIAGMNIRREKQFEEYDKISLASAATSFLEGLR